MIVCLFRHGIALDDEPRPLSPKGRRRTREAARGLRVLELGIDAILTSPLARAVETAEILSRVLGLPAPEIDERPPATILRTLRQGTPLIVGHEPDLSSAVKEWTGASIRIKKAGLAVIDRKERSLILLMTPSALRCCSRS
jgi:phosphohistidine phosphatase